MNKVAALSSVDYKKSIRGRGRTALVDYDKDGDGGEDVKMNDQSGQILLTQVNSIKKTTTFRRKDFNSIASQLQSKGMAWSPMSETLRRTSVKPPKYSKEDLNNTYFYVLKYAILAAIEPRLKTPDQTIFEFLNEEYKRWDKEVYNSKELLPENDVKVLFQSLKIHAEYLKARLESESSEIFIPLSLVKIERIGDITFAEVMEIILTNITQNGQDNPGIKEYVILKIKFILFLASFDFALTRRVFELSAIFSVDQKSFEDALIYALISATPHCTLAEALQRKALIEAHPNFSIQDFPSEEGYNKWKAFEEASSTKETDDVSKKMSSSQIRSIGIVCVRILTIRGHSDKISPTTCEITPNGSSRKTRQALGTREEPLWGDYVSFLINSAKSLKKDDDKKSVVKFTVKVYGKKKLIEKVIDSVKIKVSVGSQFLRKVGWVSLGDKPAKGSPEIYIDYSVVLFPTPSSPLPRPNLMYRILLQKFHDHESHVLSVVNKKPKRSSLDSFDGDLSDIPLYTKNLRLLVDNCLPHYGVKRLSSLMNIGILSNILWMDMSKNVISSVNRQLDDIEKNKELYTNKELGFMKTNLSVIQDVCRQYLGKFTLLFPAERGESNIDDSNKGDSEMLSTLEMFLKLFERIEIMNGTKNVLDVINTCLRDDAEFAISVTSKSVSGTGKPLSKCTMLARTVNGLENYLKKLKLYEPVFAKYVKLYSQHCSLFSAFYEKEVIPFMIEENKKQKRENTTPLEFLMLYKRSLELFSTLKECGWEANPPAIGALFVHRIVEWIWDCDSQFTKWNERIIRTETWTPLSDDVYYSHSVIDIIAYLSTAKEELIDLRFGVTEGPAVAGKYAEEIWKAYSLLLAKVIFGYVDLLHEKFTGFMPKITNLPSPKLMDKEGAATVTKYIKFSCLCISNLEACASFLNDYTDEMTSYLTEKDGIGLLEDSRLVVDITNIIDDIFADIGKKTLALTETVSKLTESMVFTLIRIELLDIQSEDPDTNDTSVKSGTRRFVKKLKTSVKKNFLSQQISSEYDTPDGAQIKSSLKDSWGTILPSAPTQITKIPRKRASMHSLKGKSAEESDPVCEYLDFYLEIFAESLQQVTFKKVLRKFWAACVKAMEVVALGSHGKGMKIERQPSLIELLGVLTEFFEVGGEGLKKEITSPDILYLRSILQFAPFKTEQIVEFSETKPGDASDRAIRAILTARGYS